MHQLKEVDILSAKRDLLMKKLDDKARDNKEVMHVYDSHMTCEGCGDTGHSRNHCPEMLEDVNYIIINNNNNYYNRPQQNQGWNQQRPNYSSNYQGRNSYNNNNNFPPLRELVSN